MSTAAITNNDDDDKPTATSSSSQSACVLLETSMGDLVIDLDCEGSPRLVQNFIKLCKARYYTQNLIHAVVLPGRFLVTGDATGTGAGGASIYALLEYYKNSNNTKNNDKDREVHLRKSAHRFLKSTGQRRLSREECQEKGRVVALELNGVADTVGSQFLITTASGENRALDGYSFATPRKDNNTDDESTSFLSLGRVVEDESNILDRMATTMYCDDNGRPYADVRIHRALIVHDPFEDPPGMADLLKHQGVVVAVAPNTSTEHAKPCLDEVLRSPSPERPEQEEVPVRIPMELVLAEMNQAAGADGTSAYDDPERERARMEELARQADRSRAVVLEMLGDLPSADITAPENVLFVCKLNAITTDEDLELIFSRFDPHVKVEIVRDHDTGQSLQYAFCEFTTKEQAAQAYFKMDNALVDDRRIKVDFSQSVSKMWDRFNQRIRQPAAAAGVRQGGGRGHIGGGGGRGRGGGRAGGGNRGWQPPPRPHHQQPQQQQRRGPPQNHDPRPPERYNNQTANNDRQHFARDNQRRLVPGDGRDNVTNNRNREDRPPESWHDNPDSRGFQRRSSVSSRDEGSHRRSREDNSGEGHRRHQRHGSRDRDEERRERGNGESRHNHGGGRNVDDVVGRDRDNKSRDSRDKYRPEHRHRDERRSSRGEGEEADSVDSRERKKDRRSRDDEKRKDDHISRRDERKRVHDDDHSNADSSRSERRSKRKHARDDRSSDDGNDSSRHRKKKTHKHEKSRHKKDRSHRHKDDRHRHRRDRGNDSDEDDRHPRKRDSHRDAEDDDHSDANKGRNHTRDDRRQRSREEHPHDRHDDLDTKERERRHRTSPDDGDGKDEESRERHRDRKHHSRRSKSSHSNKSK